MAKEVRIDKIVATVKNAAKLENCSGKKYLEIMIMPVKFMS